MIKKICIVYTHHKLGDLIWQLPYIKAISEYHNQSVDLILREKTQAKKILKEVVRQYPDTTASKLATERLRKIR